MPDNDVPRLPNGKIDFSRVDQAHPLYYTFTRSRTITVVRPITRAEVMEFVRQWVESDQKNLAAELAKHLNEDGYLDLPTFQKQPKEQALELMEGISRDS